MLWRDQQKEKIEDLQQLECIDKQLLKALVETNYESTNSVDISILKKLLTFFEDKEEKIKQKDLADLLSLKSQASSPILKLYLDMTLAIKRQNNAWLHFLIRDYIQSGIRYSWLLQTELDPLSIALYEKLVKHLRDSISEISSLEEKSREIFDEFIEFTYFSKISDNEVDIEYSFSLQDLREMFRNPKLSQDYFSFLYTQINPRISQKEKNQIINKVIKKHSKETLDARQWWSLQGKLPKEPKKRELLLEDYKNLWKSKDHFSRSIVIDAIDSLVLKKYLEEIDPYFKKAPFQIRRDFYRKLLNDQVAIDWSVYNLILLGDYPHSFLRLPNSKK